MFFIASNFFSLSQTIPQYWDWEAADWEGFTYYNFRLHHVNNEKILELAKLDFNIIQSILQEEMKNVTRWIANLILYFIYILEDEKNFKTIKKFIFSDHVFIDSSQLV